MLQPNSNPDISLHLHLQDHQFPVGCLAWSLDDTILLSSCEQLIKMWNTEVCQSKAPKSWRLTSSLVRCTHPNDRGPYGTSLSTGLGARWFRVHFGFPRSKDQLMGRVLFFRCWLTYKRSPCTAVQGSDGKQRDSWGITATRIIDLAVTPDFTRLVAIGESARDPILPTPRSDAAASSSAVRNGNNNATPNGPQRTLEYLMIVYDLTTKQPEL